MDRAATAYDLARFPPGRVVAAGPWRAITDRLGQVILATRGGAVVATVLVRRDRAAVWAPDDVYWGAADLLGGPPTPNAESLIGQVIQEAEG